MQNVVNHGASFWTLRSETTGGWVVVETMPRLSVPPGTAQSLPTAVRIFHALAMFVVTEAQAAMIRATYEQRGEFSAAVELRRLLPGIADNAQAR
jgi:hypothetical protein